MDTTVICVLDKEYPPEHSFVDGMLATLLAEQENIDVYLVVSHKDEARMPTAYKKAVCFPVLKSRRGLNRFTNYFILRKFLIEVSKTERKKGKNIVLLIRNEPIFLLAAHSVRSLFDKMVFQQSYPHELASAKGIKRKIAIAIFKWSSNSVDVLLAVTEESIIRLRNYFGIKKDELVIPLLGNETERTRAPIAPIEDGRIINFIYAGTHHESRDLEIVIEAIEIALKNGARASFTFIGGTKTEIENLKERKNIMNYVEVGSIQFIEKMPRSVLINELPSYDVGISLIPPKPLFVELSPTKLAEYLNAGLAVIATKGIPTQEKFIAESKAGMLVEWSVENMATGIIRLCLDSKRLFEMKSNAVRYSEKTLDYKHYIEKLVNVIRK